VTALAVTHIAGWAGEWVKFACTLDLVPGRKNRLILRTPKIECGIFYGFFTQKAEWYPILGTGWVLGEYLVEYFLGTYWEPAWVLGLPRKENKALEKKVLSNGMGSKRSPILGLLRIFMNIVMEIIFRAGIHCPVRTL